MNQSIQELTNFFSNREEMINYCIKITRESTIKYSILNSGNYYKIHCKDSECPFQITYNLRDSNKCPRGYYLVIKGTNINHNAKCSHFISNIKESLDPHVLAKRIMYLFNESMPTINQVLNTLHIITDNEFTANEAKYIRHLSKEIFFNTTKDTMNKLVEFAEILKNEHHWELNYDFFEGVLTSIIMFPPWSKNVLKAYPNPLIVDATFSKENIRFTSCVTVDGELHTQLIGIVIRGTEDSKGYRYIFDFCRNIVPDMHFTIISDMAPCIEKACKDSFGDKYSLVYCLFHLKENFLKKFKFKPTTKLWKQLKYLMQGKISEDTFRSLWINEESEVDIELKGLCYLCTIARHFLSAPLIHKRNIVSSQRSEMFNNIIKLKSNDAYYMLRQSFITATEWFELSATRIHKEGQIITDAAEEIMNKMILKEARNEFYDDLFHQVDEKGICYCTMHSDCGIPCPKQISFFRANKINISETVSVDWQCQTFHEAFDPIVHKDDTTPSFAVQIQNSNTIKLQDADLVASKIRYLYQNSPEYRVKINDLLEEAQINVQLPFFSLLSKTKKKQKKRYIGSIEQSGIDKRKSDIFKVIQSHIESRKMTIAALVLLANQLCETNPSIPKLTYNIKTKKAILDWYYQNWSKIKESFSEIPNQAPNGDIVSEDEDEII